jgi:hypothetical protein
MDLINSVVMLTAFALLAGALYLWRTRGPTKQVWLMVVLAVVMIADVLIWTLPAAR